MSKLELGPIGVALNVSADDRYLQEAAALEELGYRTIWLPGGQIDSLERIFSGVSDRSVGRIASCASCACLPAA